MAVALLLLAAGFLTRPEQDVEGVPERITYSGSVGGTSVRCTRPSRAMWESLEVDVCAHWWGNTKCDERLENRWPWTVASRLGPVDGVDRSSRLASSLVDLFSEMPCWQDKALYYILSERKIPGKGARYLRIASCARFYSRLTGGEQQACRDEVITPCEEKENIMYLLPELEWDSVEPEYHCPPLTTGAAGETGGNSGKNRG